MRYQVIDESIGLYACGIADLTIEQRQDFLRLWNDGSGVEALTLFADQTGKVILNRDNSGYEQYLALAKTYLSITPDIRQKVKEGHADFL